MDNILNMHDGSSNSDTLTFFYGGRNFDQYHGRVILLWAQPQSILFKHTNINQKN
jgi:hypothetical protein